MKARTESRSRARGEEVVLFNTAGQSFAISATAVDEIRNLEDLHPLSGGGKVYGILERQQSRHYVVDVAFQFHLKPNPVRRVLVLRNSAVALGVESVDRMAHMAFLYALPRAFQGEERGWYRGLALVEGRVVPVVNRDAFLTKAELAALEARFPVETVAKRASGAVPA